MRMMERLEDFGMYKIREETKIDDTKRKKSTKSSKSDETKVSVVLMEEDDEARRLERKKRSQEDMVADFVKILEQMMNPRQAVTSFVCALAGVVSLAVGLFYRPDLPDTAHKSSELALILIAYGILQILMATAFFITCMQTSIAVSKGVKDLVQIIVGLLIALVYVIIAFISLVVGIIGFYKTLCIVSFVEYSAEESAFFCPQPLFYTSLAIFILHVVMIILKSCCCK